MPDKKPRKNTRPALVSVEYQGTLPRIELPNDHTVVDLFSGAGGMTCGFWQMGFQILGAVDRQVGKPSEVLPCNETYRLNYGITPYDFDMHTLSAARLRDEVLQIPQGHLTVLISCPPCTGYSQKRHENTGKDDERNQLVAKTAPFVEAFMPEFLVMENVPEMLKGRFSHHWSQLLQELRRLQYNVWADIIDLSKLGLPQHRKRALVIARRNNGELPDMDRRIRLTLEPQNVRITLESYDMPTPVQGDRKTAADPVHAHPKIGRRAQGVFDRCRLIRDKGKGRWTGLDPAQLSQEELQLLTGRIRTALLKGDRKTFPDCYGTIRADRLSPTLIRQCGDIGTGPWFHWSEDRMLTAREMAILQGFPYDLKANPPFYRFGGALSKVYQQIGNAVPPLVSKVIAEELLALLNGQPGIGPGQIPLRPWLIG